MKGIDKRSEFDPANMEETHTPANGEPAPATSVEGVRAESTGEAVAASVPKTKQRFQFILRKLNEQNEAVETLHESKFTATGPKSVAQYLRRVAMNMAMAE